MRTAILLALVLVSACESSSNAPAIEGTGEAPRRGSAPGWTSTGSKPDAGLPPDALPLTADALAPLAPDTMPVQLPDALVAVDTLPAVAPDALGQQPDTFRPTDAKPASACTWKSKADGQTADVYLAEGSADCGKFGNLRCRVGCVAVSVEVGGTIERLTPSRQPMEVPEAGCKASFMFGDASVEAPGFCFPDAEACSKFCQ